MDGSPTSESAHIPEPDHVPPEVARTTAPAPPLETTPIFAVRSPTHPDETSTTVTEPTTTTPVETSTTATVHKAMSPTETSPTLPAPAQTTPAVTSSTLPKTEVSSAFADVLRKPVLDVLTPDMLQTIIKLCRETNKPNFWTAQFLGVSVDFVHGRHGVEDERRLARQKTEDAERRAEKSRNNSAICGAETHELLDPLARDAVSEKQYSEMSREDLFRQVVRVLCGRIRSSAGGMSRDDFAKRIGHIRNECSAERPPFSGMYDTLILTAEECETLCNKYTTAFETQQRTQGGRPTGPDRSRPTPPPVQTVHSHATLPPAAVESAAMQASREPQGEEDALRAKPDAPWSASDVPAYKTDVSGVRLDAKTKFPVAKSDVPPVRLSTAVTKLDIMISEPSKASAKQRHPPDGDYPPKKRKVANPKCTYPMHTRIKLKENPKSKGSRAYERYASYEKATTVQEYFDLGGGGDFRHDLAKGFITILDE